MRKHWRTRTATVYLRANSLAVDRGSRVVNAVEYFTFFIITPYSRSEPVKVIAVLAKIMQRRCMAVFGKWQMTAPVEDGRRIPWVGKCKRRRIFSLMRLVTKVAIRAAQKSVGGPLKITCKLETSFVLIRMQGETRIVLSLQQPAGRMPLFSTLLWFCFD